MANADIVNASLQLEIWLSELDAQGPGIDIGSLQTAIRTAPVSIQEAPDYHFFCGFMYGRMIGEGLI